MVSRHDIAMDKMSRARSVRSDSRASRAGGFSYTDSSGTMYVGKVAITVLEGKVSAARSAHCCCFSRV
jgi:hypothetical protein